MKAHPANQPRPSGRPTCLFVDIGGVLLTDGWDHHARKRASKLFKLDWSELDARHRSVFDTFEQGHLTLDEYLKLVIFYKPRSFSRSEFRKFIFAQSKPFPKMIELIKSLKSQFNLKIVVVSNEAREINAYRIRKFGLNKFVDAFISSCFVHVRKPDSEIFRMALDISQTPARDIIYLENTELFIGIARGHGIPSIHHTDFNSTQAKFSALGLSLDLDSEHIRLKKPAARTPRKK